jgi:ribonucleoside-diphosphate reductase alpha chain
MAYTESEWHVIEQMIDYSRDQNHTYAAIEQLIDKYLVKNRVTGVLFEVPQVRYAIIAATIFQKEDEAVRMGYIKAFYEAASTGKFTLATPVLAGLGTPTKQFSSCVLIKVGDSLDSIFASGELVAKYAARRAGIGLDVGAIRPLGAPIRNGEVKHTGLLPFIKKLFADLRCCCLRPDMLIEVLDEDNSI